MNTEEITITETVQEAALSLITRAEIDAQVATAKAFPRSIKQFMDKALSIATVNEEVAASCSYAVPRQGKSIEGPSVRLAEIVCTSYGNIRSGARVIANDGKTVTAQGVCHDLETNNSVTVEVKRKITSKDGKLYSEDMQVVTGNAACAIAFRNAVFKVVPAALVDDIYEKIKDVARGNAETLVIRRDKALNYARSLGVKDEQICRVLGVKKVEDVDLDKLSTFRSMLSAIRNGESTVRDIFDTPVSDPPTAEQSESDRFLRLIQDCDTADTLAKQFKHLNKYPEHRQAYLDREAELKGREVVNVQS